MSRIRTIKPEIHTDSKTGTLSDRGFRIFVGMLNFADDYGVIEGDDAQLKAQIIPHINETIDQAMGCVRSELLTRGLILMFFVDTTPYYWICNFEQHQRVDHPGKPKIPNWFEWKIREKLQQTLADKSDDLLLTFDTNKDNSPKSRETSRALAPEGKGREGKGRERIMPPDGGFVFWDSYPRRNGKKVGRGKALEVWRGLTPEDQTRALAALDAQKKHYADCKAAGLFVAEFPDAHRWLRDKRFLDEVAEIPQEKTWQEKLKERLAAKGQA